MVGSYEQNNQTRVLLNSEKWGCSGSGTLKFVLSMVILMVPAVKVELTTSIEDIDAPSGCWREDKYYVYGKWVEDPPLKAQQ